MRELDIDYAWEPVISAPQSKYSYPHEVNRYIQEHYSKGAIYRWAFFKAESLSPDIVGSPCSVYVGETENLATRLRGHVHPGSSQATNKRLKVYLDQQLGLGTTILLSILRFEAFHITIDREKGDSRLVAELSLGNPYIRKMMENFAVVVHDPVHCEILNRGLNPIERRRVRAEKALLNCTLEERLAAIDKPRPSDDKS